MYKRWLCVVLAAMLMSACTHYISQDSLRLVSQTVPFGAVMANPDNYIGGYLLVGGKIAKVTNSKEGGEIEVVQVRIDSDGRPLGDFRNSEGRFLAQTGYFVDPVIYKEGMVVSLVGQVKGKKVQPLDAISYTYPVLAVRELHLWQADELYRGYGPYPYGPYNYPYDYPYSYGLCDFGFGPYPYYGGGWGQDWCYSSDRLMVLPDSDDLRRRHEGRERSERHEGHERSERHEGASIPTERERPRASSPPVFSEPARPRESSPPMRIEPRSSGAGEFRGGEGAERGGSHGGFSGGGGRGGGGRERGR